MTGRANHLVAAVVAVAASLTTPGLALAQSAVEPVVPPRVSVSGLTQGEWTAAWWQWAYSFSADESPIVDRVGDRCAAGQKGSVWFLAGVYGSAPALRRCTVPAGKHLFFPIINYMSHATTTRPTSCDELAATAKVLTDNATQLTLEIDGVEVVDVPSFRQATPECFNLGARVDEFVFPTAANGYFVMLKPLPPGRHTIKWGGVLATLRQAVVYELTVIEASSPTFEGAALTVASTKHVAEMQSRAR